MPPGMCGYSPSSQMSWLCPCPTLRCQLSFRPHFFAHSSTVSLRLQPVDPKGEVKQEQLRVKRPEAASSGRTESQETGFSETIHFNGGGEAFIYLTFAG